MFGEASGKGLISIEDWSLWRIEACLERARGIFEARRRGEPIPYKVEGKTLATLFYEPSTRTRVSFELAAQELGMKVLSIQAAASSVIKGESLLDSVRTLEAMGVDVIVLRHPLSGAPAFVAGHSRAAIINAGDGMHEHPTQALLDAFTVWRAKGRIQGLTVAICGDVLHSRVARSDALLFSRFGCEVRFVCLLYTS
ncbi:MAG: aspartate carbamoyltransferase, partial [Deltaproteobacteria bacterium]|nr:aspartate carbamoyltransferase [Deltaproteobacteria bacterium]